MRRILIVDDEPSTLHLMTRILEERYEILPASGPWSALEIIRNKSQIDLIISDMEMPDMRGADLLIEIHRLFPSIKGVLMSGNADLLGELPMGVPFLKKPFSTTELFEVIETALGGNALSE